MNQYHKINSVFKRSRDGKQMLWGEYSLPEFEYLKDNLWEFTEKVDGTNIRVMYSGVEAFGDDLTFGGKTDNAQIPAHLVNKLNELFSIDMFRDVFPSDNNEAPEERKVCLYGEGYGVKIQAGGGNYNPTGVDFVLFDIKIGEWWLKREDVNEIANKLGIKAVPVVGVSTLEGLIAMCRHGFKSQWGDFIAEGIVARPTVELRDRAGHRIITKLKYKDFKDV
jgi:hypothetical protein